MPRPKKGQPVKSDFIRENANLPITELIAKAKAAGLSIDAQTVQQVHTRDASKKAPAAKKTVAAPAPKKTAAPKKKPGRPATAKTAKAAPAVAPTAPTTTTATPAGRKPGRPAKVATVPAKPTTAKSPATKPGPRKAPASDFIRSLPLSTPTADVIKQGAAKGIKFSSALVYVVRGKMDGKTTAPAAKKAAPKAAVTPAKKKPGRPKKTASTAMKTTKPAKTTMSKSDFVRSLPNATPAKEVIARAKAAGIEISETMVYGVRTFDKTRAKKKGKPGKAAAPIATTAPIAKAAAPAPAAKKKPGRPAKVAPTAASPKASSSPSSAEASFRKAFLDLGIERAEQIVGEMKLGIQKLLAVG